MSYCSRWARTTTVAAGMTLAGTLTAPAASPEEVRQLVYEATVGCRSTTGPNPSREDLRMCDESAEAARRLEKMGWCFWQPGDTPMSDARWRPCSPAERRAMEDQAREILSRKPAPTPAAPTTNEWAKFLSDEMSCEIEERLAGTPPAATRCAWTQQGVDWKGIGRN